MTDLQEKMLRDLDRKVDSIIETLAGNNIGTRGLSNDFTDLSKKFYLHVEDNNRNFNNLFKYKNYAIGALTILGGISGVLTALIIKIVIK